MQVEDKIKEEILKLENNSIFIRQGVILVLEEMGKIAVPYLMDALEDQDWHVREVAAEVLMEIGDISTLNSLKKALPIEPEDSIRTYIEKAIEKIEIEKSIISAFRNLNSANNLLRSEGIKTLVNIGNPSIPYLIDLLNDENLELRSLAVEILSEIGNDKAWYTLIKTLDTEKEEYVAGNIRKALEKIERNF